MLSAISAHCKSYIVINEVKQLDKQSINNSLIFN